jgi:K+-transporting ATPase ATPase C chain
MKKSVFISIRLLAVFTVITGMIYPLLITGASLLFFHDKAGGSLVKTDGRVVGSELIGQQTENPRYFHSRPSAVDYQAIPSGASNLSWSDKRLKELVQLRKEAFLSENFLPDTTAIPQEMLFASASGIDPHISPRAAYLQVKRIALSRDFTDEQTLQLNELIMNLEEGPQFSVFGEQRINVFLLNLELDKIK